MLKKSVELFILSDKYNKKKKIIFTHAYFNIGILKSKSLFVE